VDTGERRYLTHKGTSVEIDKDGNALVNGVGKITVISKGDISATGEGNVSVDCQGDVDVSSQGNVMVTTARALAVVAQENSSIEVQGGTLNVIGTTVVLNNGVQPIARVGDTAGPFTIVGGNLTVFG
jgi:hypothetical protein